MQRLNAPRRPMMAVAIFPLSLKVRCSLTHGGRLIGSKDWGDSTAKRAGEV